MPFPTSLTQTLRPGQISLGAGWRAYFAPFNRVASASTANNAIGPTILDLQNGGPFKSASLPAGWFDLGYTKDAKVTPGTKFASIKTGHRNVTRVKFIGDMMETFEIKFMERSRMVDSLASGMQVFNLVTNPVPPTGLLGPLSASGATAAAIGASGYLPAGISATSTAGKPILCMPAGSGAAFPAGTFIVADQDYTGQSGYVGDAGASVYPGTVTDIDYIRKTSDYVARVVSVVPNVVAGQDALVLNEQFVGGGNSVIIGAANYGPTAGAKVQIVKGYTRRNGGTKITDWSALLLLDTEELSQFAIYYPHLSPNSLKGMSMDTITDSTGIQELGSDIEFEAIAFNDPLDGEDILSYQAYYPAAGEDIQI